MTSSIYLGDKEAVGLCLIQEEWKMAIADTGNKTEGVLIWRRLG